MSIKITMVNFLTVISLISALFFISGIDGFNLITLASLTGAYIMIKLTIAFVHIENSLRNKNSLAMVKIAKNHKNNFEIAS